MYAIKEAMIAKEHSGGNLDCTIFNMDIRSFGKDYEKYTKEDLLPDKLKKKKYLNFFVVSNSFRTFI